MPFVDLGKQNNTTATPAVDDTVQNQVPEPNVVVEPPVETVSSKDPVSLEDGLIHNAYQAPIQNNDGITQQQFDDGTKVVSKPFETQSKQAVEESIPNVESSTAYPTLEPVKQEEVPTVATPDVQDQTTDQIDEIANIEEKKEIEVPVVDQVQSQVVSSETPLTTNEVLETQSKSPETIQTEELVSQNSQINPEPSQIPVTIEETEVAKMNDSTINTPEQVVAPNDAELPALEEAAKVAPEEIVSVDSNVLKPSQATLQEYINYAMAKDSSDIHFAVNYPVSLRLDGRLEKIGQEVLKPEDAERLLLHILSEDQKNKLMEGLEEVDFMYVDESKNRFRVNVFKEKSHVSAAFRWIPKTVRTVDELALPPILKEFSKIPYGLVLVTGPTGSGKTTTIAAMIEEINRTEPRHIITIEDPVEYVYEPSIALIAQRSMHQDTKGWNEALRAALRQDPDVVLIGEMRDHETISSALTIAETGHLVFATLHTNTAAQSIDRIIDVFPEGQQNQVRSQLSMMLSGVISQRLIPLQKGGRKVAMEILIGTPAVKNAIREGKTHQIDNIIQTSAESGMVSLEKSLVELIRKGDIDVDTAKNFTSKPDEIDLLLR